MTQPNEPNEPDEPSPERNEPSPTWNDEPLRPDEAGTPAEPAAPAEPGDRIEPPPASPPADSPKTDRPSSTDWREPPWFPPRDPDRREPKSNLAAIVVGLLILGVGVYFFFDRTLGVPMPPIRWGSLWPVLLIVLGGVVLLRSIQRR